MTYKKQLAPAGVAGPVIFNTFGDATLTLLIPGTNNNHRDDDARLDSLDDMAGVIATMPGWYVLQYVPRQVPVSAVAARVSAALREDQTLDDNPKWDEQVYEDAKWVAGLDDAPVEDLTLLTLQLPAASSLAGGGATRPSRARIKKARAQANEVLRRVRVLIPNAEPVDAGFLSWFYDYCAAFGGMEPPYTLDQYQREGLNDTVGKLVPILGCALNETALERPRGRGAREELTALLEGWMNITSPLIEDPMCPFPETDAKGKPFPNSQNTFVKNYVVVGAPETTLYPEQCINDRFRRLDFPVRVAAMGDPISDTATLRKLDRTFKELDYAVTQAARDTSPPEELEASIRAARALYARVVNDQTAREPLSIVISIAATTREELDARARVLRDTLKNAGIRTLCPPGQQTELWAAMLPGARTPEFLKLFARHLLPEGVAALGLHHSDEAGDGIGRVWGTLSDRYPMRLVHRLVTLGPDAREGMAYGGSITANCGDQGSGKSLDGKGIFHDVCALGGGGATIDLTPEGEWEAALRAMDVQATVVKFATKGHVIDPMRVFTRNQPTDDAVNDLGLSRQGAAAQAENHTLGYLSIMLGIDKGSAKYKVLRRAIQIVLSDDTQIAPSLPNLLHLLRAWAGEPNVTIPKLKNRKPDPIYTPPTAAYEIQAQDLVLDLTGVAESGDVGSQLFGDGQVLDLTTQVIDFAAPDLKMSDPTSKAYIYLATAYCLRFMSATDRPNIMAFSELRALTKDPYGVDLVDLVYRQSRRRYAVVFVDSQLARDFIDGEQINQRTVARTRNEDNAVAALHWLGINNPSKELIKWVRSMDPKRGQKVYRDQKDRIALVDVLKPHNELRYEAARTDHDRKPQAERTV